MTRGTDPLSIPSPDLFSRLRRARIHVIRDPRAWPRTGPDNPPRRDGRTMRSGSPCRTVISRFRGACQTPRRRVRAAVLSTCQTGCQTGSPASQDSRRRCARPATGMDKINTAGLGRQAPRPAIQGRRTARRRHIHDDGGHIRRMSSSAARRCPGAGESTIRRRPGSRRRQPGGMKPSSRPRR